MTARNTAAEVNIHLRARSADRDLIDQAAELVGSNRSQFMLSSALERAQNVILDRTVLRVSTETFDAVLAALDRAPGEPVEEGVARLAAAHAFTRRERD